MHGAAMGAQKPLLLYFMGRKCAIVASSFILMRQKIAPHKYAVLPDYSRFPSCVVERPLRWENMSSGCLFAECALLVPAADGTKASERKPRHGIIKVQLASR